MNSVAEWISIPNASGYQVSLKGTVRSVDRYVPCGKGTRLAAGCELKPYRTPKGYLVVTITDDDRRRADIGVHVLVCAKYQMAQMEQVGADVYFAVAKPKREERQ